MATATEHIRRMRGGAQAHLLRCKEESRGESDKEGFYVVKFQNNPQGVRVLANELLGTRLAARLGLVTPKAGVVRVDERLIAMTDDLVVQLGRRSEPCRAGASFGSRYPGRRPGEQPVYDFLPDEILRRVKNLDDFAGMLVFDQWTCNTNGRQVIFTHAAGEEQFEAQMIDQGFCFNAGEWNFPDGPLRGLYARSSVYAGVRGMEKFERWLGPLESKHFFEVFDQAASEIPPEWYEDQQDELYRLLEQLDRRRRRVRALLIAVKNSTRVPFPNWR